MNLAEIPEATAAAAATWLLLLLLLRFKIWGPLLLLLLFLPSLSIPQFRRKNCLEMNGNLMVNRFLIGYGGCGRICMWRRQKKKEKRSITARTLSSHQIWKSSISCVFKNAFRIMRESYVRGIRIWILCFCKEGETFCKKRDDCLKSSHLAIIIRKKWRRKSSAENWKIEEE